MSSLSSVEFIERIKGTEVRDLSRAAYLGRYTWVCMSTSSLQDMAGEQTKTDQVTRKQKRYFRDRRLEGLVNGVVVY